MSQPSPGAGPPSIAALAAELAMGLPDVRVSTSRGETEWSRRSVTFASLDDDGLELRLDTAVAAAALRTPDTTPSARGRPWIRFAPAVLDGHAVDRASAWFGLAYRRAAES
jgi:hypothetical protein